MFFSSCSSMMAVYPNDGGGMTVAAVSQKELNGPPSTISSKASEAKYKQIGIIPPPPGFLPAGSNGSVVNSSLVSNTGNPLTMNTSGSCCGGFVPTTTGLKKSAQSFTSHSHLKSQMAEMPIISNNHSSYQHHNNYNNHHHHSKHHSSSGKHQVTSGGGHHNGATAGEVMMMTATHVNNYHHHSNTGQSAVVHPGHLTGAHCHPPPLPYQILQQQQQHQQSQHHHCTSCHKQNGGKSLKNSYFPTLIDTLKFIRHFIKNLFWSLSHDRVLLISFAPRDSRLLSGQNLLMINIIKFSRLLHCFL